MLSSPSSVSLLASGSCSARREAAMAARLLSRSKTLGLPHFLQPSVTSHHLCPLHHGVTTQRQPESTSAAAGSGHRSDLVAPAVDFARCFPTANPSTLPPQKIWSSKHFSPCLSSKPLHAGTQALPCGAMRHHAYNVPLQFYLSTGKDKIGKTVGGIEDAKVADESDPPKGKDDCSKVISFSPLEGTIKGHTSVLANESLKLKRIELSQKITYALIPALLLVSKTKLTTSLLIFSVFWQIYGFFKEIFLDYVHHEVTRKWVLIYFKLLLIIVAKDMFLYFGFV